MSYQSQNMALHSQCALLTSKAFVHAMSVLEGLFWYVMPCCCLLCRRSLIHTFPNGTEIASIQLIYMLADGIFKCFRVRDVVLPLTLSIFNRLGTKVLFSFSLSQAQVTPLRFTGCCWDLIGLELVQVFRKHGGRELQLTSIVGSHDHHHQSYFPLHVL